MQCRDLEDNYHEKVWAVAVATLENVAKDNLEEDMPEDVKMVSLSLLDQTGYPKYRFHYGYLRITGTIDVLL